MSELSAYFSSTITPATATRDDIVLIKNNAEYRRIIIPEILKNDPSIIALKELTNSYFLYQAVSFGRFKALFDALNHFIECLSISAHLMKTKKDQRLPLDTGSVFVRYLINKQYSEFTIYSHTTAIKILLQNTISAKCSEIVKLKINDWRRIKSLLNEWPYIPKPERQDGRQGLVEKFGLGCTENEVLMSIKLFCPWFINECASIRNDFKTNCPESYAWLLSQAKDEQKRKILSEPATAHQSDEQNLRRKAYAVMLRAAAHISSPLYLDAIFFNGLLKTPLSNDGVKLKKLADNIALEFPNPAIKYGKWIKKEILAFFETFINSESLVCRRRLLESHNLTFFDLKAIFSPLSLILPSPEEKIAISWLLASDRVQLSNLERIRIRDVDIVKNQTTGRIHVSTFKGRNTTTASCIYRKNEPAYEALKNYKDFLLFGYENNLIDTPLPPEDSQFLPGLHQHYFLVHQYKKTSYLFLPIIVAGSDTQSAYFEYCKRIKTSGDPNPFLECLLTAFESNSEFSVARGKRQAKLKEFIKSGNFNNEGIESKKTKLKEADNSATLTLSPQNVAQTCVLANDSERTASKLTKVRIASNMSVKMADIDNIDQNLHAAKMRHNTHSEASYADFSKCRKKIDIDEHFGELVGTEMCTIATTLAQRMMNSTHLVSIREVDKLLNIPTTDTNSEQTSDTLILERAGLEDFVVEKTGIFSKNGHTFIVKMPLVAALIEAKIRHIESQLKSLISSNPLRIKKALSLLIFYKALLNEFNPITLKQGRTKYKQFQFNFSDLNV